VARPDFYFSLSRERERVGVRGERVSARVFLEKKEKPSPSLSRTRERS